MGKTLHMAYDMFTSYLPHLLCWDVSASQILVTAEAHGSSQNFRGSIQHRLWARWSARLSSPPILNVCMCTNVAYTTVCMFVCVCMTCLLQKKSKHVNEVLACKWFVHLCKYVELKLTTIKHLIDIIQNNYKLLFDNT